MRGGFLGWWRLRTVREQRMLLVMAALIAVTLVWFAIIRPVGDALSDARTRHANAVIDLAEAKTMADAIVAAQGRSRREGGESIAALAERRAREAGFEPARIEPDGDRVKLVFDSARPQAFFAWAVRMERDAGLIVDTMTARTNSDATLAVELTLRARGG